MHSTFNWDQASTSFWLVLSSSYEAQGKKKPLQLHFSIRKSHLHWQTASRSLSRCDFAVKWCCKSVKKKKKNKIKKMKLPLTFTWSRSEEVVLNSMWASLNLLNLQECVWPRGTLDLHHPSNRMRASMCVVLDKKWATRVESTKTGLLVL